MLESTAVISRRNEWWTSGKSSIETFYKTARDEINTVMDNMDTRRIQIVIGARRVGKSTLIQQAISRLLKDGVEPKRILFFSCDDPTIFNGDTTIGDVIEMYASDVLHEAIPALRSRVYVFIDEIHTAADWQLWLKSYFEPQYNIKFVVSGSSASHLFDGAKESLLGRTDTLRIMPLNFMQFCKFWAVYRNDTQISGFCEMLPTGSFYQEPLSFFDMINKNAWQWDNFKPYANAVMREFLLYGGYPEFFAENNNPLLWQKRLAEDIVGQGIYRDIISIYRIKTPEKLERLLFFIADNNGQDFNMKTIADTIGGDNETVSTYLTYLSQAYMTIVLNNYSPNIGKTLRKNKTLYVLDNGIANALLRLRELSDTQTGHIVESICARDALAACENNFWSLFYWRDKDTEVDLVLDRKTEVLPIEVKYRNNVKSTGLQAFSKTVKGVKIHASVVITKDKIDRVGDTLYIPFWLVH